MKTELPISLPASTVVSATVINGQLQLDEPLHLPDHSRVQVRVEAANEQAISAWQSLQARLLEHPIHAANAHYTREELNDRD